MTIDEVEKYFGSRINIARALGRRSRSNLVSNWERFVGGVPYQVQLELYVITRGKLKPEVMPKAIPPKPEWKEWKAQQEKNGQCS